MSTFRATKTILAIQQNMLASLAHYLTGSTCMTMENGHGHPSNRNSGDADRDGAYCDQLWPSNETASR